MNRVPQIDLTAQMKDVQHDLFDAVEEVLLSGQFVLGQNVSLLENEIAQFCGTKHGIGVANGTDALVLSLAAFNIGPGDEVITTPFTFFATVEAILRVGATPVFADVDRNTFNINVDEIERHITRKTKAILPVHLFGLMADMPAIRRLADAHGLIVIEDGCQAIGAQWEGHGLGHYGDAAVLSFFPTKNLSTCGDGGMILLSNDETAKRLRRLRIHGSERKYEHEEIGWNSRLDELHAAILRVKLRKLNEWNQNRRHLAERYNHGLKNLPLILPTTPDSAEHVFHLYTVLSDRRDDLMAFLTSNGIGCGVYYPVPMHLQRAVRSLGYNEGDFPVAENLSKHALSLPMFPELNVDDQDFVIEKICLFFQ
jgi:dTDP-4-amino-4,6-dideoxygalactose transaminase